MKTTLILVIDHKKPIADLTDIAAGRIYTLDGVEDVTAELQPESAVALREWNLIDPKGSVVASETSCIRAWARINGYKPTVEGLLGYEERGWRVRAVIAPQSTPEAA